jgi:hypothetical protein
MTDDDSPDDTGAADPALVAALSAGDVLAIRRTFLSARVLVPILATGDESDAAEIAVPRLVGADGRHALPVFSCYDTLRAWRPNARPVPMPGERAAAAAISEGYAAVVIDIAGPVSHTVEIVPSPTQPPPNC